MTRLSRVASNICNVALMANRNLEINSSSDNDFDVDFDAIVSVVDCGIEVDVALDPVMRTVESASRAVLIVT